MHPIVYALSVSGEIEKWGAYAGLASVLGLAVLSLLYFSQAREVKRLREWAGRAPERAQELEQRVTHQAELARQAAAQRRVVAQARPGSPAQPATAAGAAGAASPAGQAATAAAAAASAAPPAAAEGAAAPGTAEAAESTGAGPATATAPGGPPAEGDGSEAAKETAAAASPPEPGAEGDGSKPGEEAAAAAASPTPEGDGSEPGAEAAGAAPPQDTEDEPPPSVSPPVPEAPPAPNGSGAADHPPVLPPPAPLPAPAPAPPRASAPTVSVTAQRGRLASRLDDGHGGRYTALIVAGVLAVIGGGVLLVTKLTGGESPSKPNVTSSAPVSSSSQGTSSTSGTGGPLRRSSVTVAVLNGTTFTGLAKEASDRVVAAGFAQGTVTNAADQARSATIVSYAPGYRRAALVVAGILKAGSSSVEPIDSSTQAIAGKEAGVVVTVGADRQQ